MTSKWQKMAATGRKRISFVVGVEGNTRRKATAIAEKGYFLAYASDGQRYMVPLPSLQRSILQELLKMDEEEFGLNIDGTVALPCDSMFIDYIMSLVQRDMCSQMENALVACLSSSRRLPYSILLQSHLCRQMPLEGLQM